MTVRNRGTKKKPHWHYDFNIRGHRYRSSIPEATTKKDAVEAEVTVKRRVFEGTYGAAIAGSRLFSEFIDKDYLPWAKTNKRTWQNDERHALILKQAFTGKKLREVSPLMIEKLKRELASQMTKFGTARAPASVNLVLATGSGIFTLACDTDQASKNPFRKVKKLVVNNHQFRYLGWDEEPRLIQALVNPAVSVRSMRHNGSIRQHESQQAMPLRASSQNPRRVEAVPLPEEETQGGCSKRTISGSALSVVGVNLESADRGSDVVDRGRHEEARRDAGSRGSRIRTPQFGTRPAANKTNGRRGVVELKAAQRAHLRDAIPVAIGTGLRRGEQTTLRVRQCDFARNVVIVEHSKSNRSREVPMNDDVRAILLRLCKGKRRDDYLFVNPQTKRPYLDFKKGFAAACAEAGIEGLSWKALRHTFGTRLGEAGHTAFDIADLMGHSDVRTSMRYVHATDHRKQEAVQSTMLSRRATA